MVDAQKIIKKLTDPLRKIEFTKEIVTAFLIGGLLMTALNPLFTPPIQDFERQIGIISSPSPQISVEYRNTTDDPRIVNTTDVDINASKHRVFYVKINNPTNKVITDMNLALLFSGCPEQVGVWLTTLDSALVAPNADEITAGRVLGGCGARIEIEELPPQHSAISYAVVDMSSENEQLTEDSRLDEWEIALLGNYEWNYNGRTYFESIETPIHVDDRFEEGDQIN